MTADTDAAVAFLDARGYDVSRQDDRARGVVATPGPDARPLLDHRPVDERPVAVVAGSADATTILQRIAQTANDGYLCLFVTDPGTAGVVREVLAAGGVRDESDGLRSFYRAPDRIPCRDGSLAACRTEASLAWTEARIRSEDRLVLTDGGVLTAVLDGVDALLDPGPDPAAFPYTYRRGSDKRLHVTDRRGREVGVFNTMRAMKHEAYRPVPEPLVPEHVFRSATRLSDAWAVAVVEEGRVTNVVTA